MIAFAHQCSPGDHADWSANALGVIGDSRDKRFTFVRTDGKTNDPAPPEFVFVIDWRGSEGNHEPVRC